jgi:pulcherriminic acid synthase
VSGRSWPPPSSGAVSRSAAALAGVAAADLVETTSHIPIAIIAEILGFPEDEADVLFEMGKLFTEGLVDAEGILAAADAHRRLSERLDPMLDERLSHPADDLITRIASANADGQQLSRDEMFSLISFVLAAGGPTTDLGLRNVWHALLSEPGELEACRADPDRVQRAISETLRRDGPIACEDRRTTTEVEWYGTVIPAGSDIVIILGAANTDDSVFADPEQFDPDRTDLLMGTERKRGYKEAGVAGHLAFGLGTHFCIGYQLARVEIARATEAVLLELPGVRLREPQTLEIRGYERSLRELPVELATTR